uniref:Uncharacterized protein n=1 Tax=Strigamia maritima TaxID=126957 RepID=T1JAX9_STRMM
MLGEVFSDSVAINAHEVTVKFTVHTRCLMRRTCELTSSGVPSCEVDNLRKMMLLRIHSECWQHRQHGLRRTGQDFAARARTSPHGPGLRRINFLKFHYKGVMLPNFFSKLAKSGE